jgi:hypothetical protein
MCIILSLLILLYVAGKSSRQWRAGDFPALRYESINNVIFDDIDAIILENR